MVIGIIGGQVIGGQVAHGIGIVTTVDPTVKTDRPGVSITQGAHFHSPGMPEMEMILRRPEVRSGRELKWSQASRKSSGYSCRGAPALGQARQGNGHHRGMTATASLAALALRDRVINAYP